MARLLANLVQAALAADITDTDTTVTFTAPLREYGVTNLATIAAPDTLTLRVGFELLHVTAYTSGATSATVVRGAEGSTATAHNAGDMARHVSTDADFAGGIDASVLTTDADLLTRTAGVPARLTRSDLAVDPAFSGTYRRRLFVPPGRWAAPAGAQSTFAFAIGDARIAAFDLPAGTIDRLGFDVPTAGQAGVALSRVAAWFDNEGVPGLLAADGGQIATDSTGAKNAVVSIAHPGGTLWVCAWNQAGAPTATLRYMSSSVDAIVKDFQPTAETAWAWAATIAAAPGDNPAGAFTGSSSFNAPRVTVRYA